MLFYSPAFFPFFALVFVLYWAIPAQRFRTWVLLAASFYFYASWNHWLALIIAVSSALDYLVARGLDRSSSSAWRRTLMIGSLGMNLALLFYFKYVNFFLDSLEATMSAAGVGVSMPTLEVILPIGISFYTFEAINYIVDVYRRKIPAERNLANFMLFITFFPHLVAGPIVRARDFLPQIVQQKRWNWTRLQFGCEYFLLGLVKKLVIADRLAIVVDPVFADPEGFSTRSMWLAVVAYSVQIYCDFSGYSDMAIGLAHMLGFKLAKNFDMPYLAANVSEFWRRWHISLSTWLRDYLFIPMGGSRGVRSQTYRNLMVTMVLGGLWHGASWTFVLWGVLHGLFLIVHHLSKELWTRWPRVSASLDSAWGLAASRALTFLCVSLAWVCFRAPSFANAKCVYERLFSFHLGRGIQLSGVGLAALLLAVGLAHWVGQLNAWRRRRMDEMPAPIVGLAYALALAIVVLLTPDDTRPFIYFQF